MSNDTARKARFRKVVAMFLDGASDRASDDAPMRKYAHIHRGSLTVCVTDENDPDPAPLAKFYKAPKWTWLGVIDLDDGELVASSDETALGRAPS